MKSFAGLKSVAGFAVFALMVALPTTRARADFSQDFEVDTSGWFPSDVTDTVNREADGYVSPVPYASGVTSASPTHHARLRRPDQCDVDSSGSIGPSVQCPGPFTRWGGYNSIWNPYTTQVDVYLDVAYAIANPDSIAGNIGCLTTDASDTTCKGTRFDYSSAINDSSGNFLRDFAFDVGTGDPNKPTPCANGGFVVTASTNLLRSGIDIYDPGKDPFCIGVSGWYTLKQTFMDVGGVLQVLMEIFPAGNAVPLHQWTLSAGDMIANVGCNRYGWFANQEIWDLAIDNSIMVGCGVPATTTTSTTETTTTSTTEPTTSTTMVQVTTSTTVTQPSSTTTVTVSTSTTTTQPCVPTGPEAGNCNDMIDNDCDGKTDCVDEDCNTDPACPIAHKDPTSIKFSRSGGPDLIKGHATLESPPVDVGGVEVGILLSDLQGNIYGFTLKAGQMTSLNGKTFRYRDTAARTSPTGGVYQVKIKQRTGGYSFSFTAYGDLSGADNANMRLQFYIGDAPKPYITIDAPWIQTPSGWRAPKDH
jgi:hypothetical protein